MTFYLLLDDATREKHIFQYWHQAQHYVNTRGELRENDVIMIFRAPGDYQQALENQKKNEESRIVKN